MRPDIANVLRRHLAEAMARRAEGVDGEARRWLDERLAQLQAAMGEGNEALGAPSSESVPRGTLGTLVADMEATRPDTYPQLPVLDDFRALWTRIRAEGQLHQSQQDLPSHAGPLNASALVHRSMALMRELSPGYLRQFLSYVDDLSWMERIEAAAAAPVRATPQPTAPGKAARKKSRARRE